MKLYEAQIKLGTEEPEEIEAKLDGFNERILVVVEPNIAPMPTQTSTAPITGSPSASVAPSASTPSGTVDIHRHHRRRAASLRRRSIRQPPLNPRRKAPPRPRRPPPGTTPWWRPLRTAPRATPQRPAIPLRAEPLRTEPLRMGRLPMDRPLTVLRQTAPPPTALPRRKKSVLLADQPHQCLAIGRE